MVIDQAAPAPRGGAPRGRPSALPKVTPGRRMTISTPTTPRARLCRQIRARVAGGSGGARSARVRSPSSRVGPMGPRSRVARALAPRHLRQPTTRAYGRQWPALAKIPSRRLSPGRAAPLPARRRRERGRSLSGRRRFGLDGAGHTHRSRPPPSALPGRASRSPPCSWPIAFRNREVFGSHCVGTIAHPQRPTGVGYTRAANSDPVLRRKRYA